MPDTVNINSVIFNNGGFEILWETSNAADFNKYDLYHSLVDEPENYEYKIIEQYLMTNGDTSTMKKALEEYLMHASKLNLANEYGGTIEYLNQFFS